MKPLPYTLFVKNVHFSATPGEAEAEIRRKIRGVLRFTIPPGPSEGGHQGYGFLSFDSARRIEAALALNGVILLRGRPIYILKGWAFSGQRWNTIPPLNWGWTMEPATTPSAKTRECANTEH